MILNEDILKRVIPNKFKFIAFFFIISINGIGFAQSTRGLINDGVDYYDDTKFSEAEVNFKKGAEQSPES